jgi:hypothetical protein
MAREQMRHGEELSVGKVCLAYRQPLAGRDGLFADELVVKEQPKNVENRPIDVDSR